MGDSFYNFVAYLFGGLWVLGLLIAVFESISKSFKGSKEYEVVNKRISEYNTPSEKKELPNEILNTTNTSNESEQHRNVQPEMDRLLDLPSQKPAKQIVMKSHKKMNNINANSKELYLIGTDKQVVNERIEEQHQEYLQLKDCEGHSEEQEVFKKCKDEEWHRRNKEYHKNKKDEIEEKELLWAIREEKKEDSEYLLGKEPLVKKGYCNYYMEFINYCTKYDFGPVYCTSSSNEYKCTWRERRLPNYRIEYNEEIQPSDIKFEKRLTMFGEYYYDHYRFNKENFEDMLDFYSYILEHEEWN